jgi:hypothetical protein
MLGHTSIVLTADTYTSALHELQITAAAATVRLVLAAAARNPGQAPCRAVGALESPLLPRPGYDSIRSAPSDPVDAAKGRMARPHAPHLRPTKIKAA